MPNRLVGLAEESPDTGNVSKRVIFELGISKYGELFVRERFMQIILVFPAQVTSDPQVIHSRVK